MSHDCLVHLDEGISGHRDHVSARAGSLINVLSYLFSAGLVHTYVQDRSC